MTVLQLAGGAEWTRRPTRRLLVARERANLVGLKLFGSEADDPCVVESTTHLGCLLENVALRQQLACAPKNSIRR